jgi:Fe-S oxidoreductase
MGMDRMIGVNRVLGKIGIDATGIVGTMNAAGKKDP